MAKAKGKSVKKMSAAEEKMDKKSGDKNRSPKEKSFEKKLKNKGRKNP